MRLGPIGRMCLSCAALLLIGACAWAEDATIPIEDQVPIYLKILTYDRSISPEGRTWVKIGIIYDPTRADSDRCYKNIKAQLEENAEKTINGIPYVFRGIPLGAESELAHIISEEQIDALYVSCDCRRHLAMLRKVARRKDVLTMAAVGDYVNEGLSIGTIWENSKPRIVVSLPALKAEGRDFSASFLRVCKIIR